MHVRRMVVAPYRTEEFTWLCKRKMRIKVVHVVETDSTNRWLREYGGEENVCVWADYQTAGRGCGTNKWESERGQNLLFSVLCHPVGLSATAQFALLEAQSLALQRVLASYASDVTIKWPNDIYWRDSKLSGTLSECRLQGGMVRDCILGTGLNLNQERFVSDAPNPVSLRQITGTVYQPDRVLQEILNALEPLLKALNEGQAAAVHRDYVAALYRRTGFHAYSDEQGRFEAELVTVEPDGHLVLRDHAGRERRYMFKEVRFESN